MLSRGSVGNDGFAIHSAFELGHPNRTMTSYDDNGSLYVAPDLYITILFTEVTSRMTSVYKSFLSIQKSVIVHILFIHTCT